MQFKSVFTLYITAMSCLLNSSGAARAQNPGSRDDVVNLSSQPSNLNTRNFCQDSLGYMWIATFRGLNRYNGYEFFRYFHDDKDSLSLDNDFILSLFLDSSHRLWISTATGVNRYDFVTNTFQSYPTTKGKTYTYSFFEDRSRTIWAATSIGAGWIDTLQHKVILDVEESPSACVIMEDQAQKLWVGINDSPGLAYRTDSSSSWEYVTVPGRRQVTCMFSDQQGLWWLGTNAGIVLFDPIAQTFRSPPATCLKNPLLNSTHINFIKEISPLKLLIGTESQGLFQYDIPSQTLLHNEPQQLGILGSDQLLTCYVDRQENVWIGSFDRGFAVWKRSSEYFNTDYRLSNAFKDKFVTRTVEDIYGNLWISTRYHGLFHYASSSGKITGYNSQNSALFKDNLIESLFIDSQNRIWIGLSEELLMGSFTAEGQLTVRARKNIKGMSVMTENKTGTLWAGTLGALYRLTVYNDRLEADTVYKSNVPDICVLSCGKILFSSYDEGVFSISSAEGKVEQIALPSAAARSIATHCITLFEDSQQRLWMGSYGNGMLCLSGEQCHVYTREDGLPSNDVLCFRQDKQGDIWISTSYGISRMRDTDTAFVNYFADDGTLGNQFHEKAGMRHSDGRIFFAGNHGLTFFNPAAVMPNKYPPQIHLDDLKIMNRSVKPAAKGSILTKNIAFTQHITLDHTHTVVSFDYSGIDFLAPQKLTYAYKLEGFDSEWNHVGNFRRATYSNLAPGKYTFTVKAINGDGVESLRPAFLHITVKPAPWFSWQAIWIYCLLLATSAFLLFRLLFRMKLSKQLLEMEHSERERERQVAEMKMTFFTNISHELRTPLTLISAPLEQLLTQGSPDTSTRQLLAFMSRNVRRLLRLMNQLLDFRKMESGILALRVSFTDIVPHILSVREAFAYQSAEKEVALTFEPHAGRLEMWIDSDKLEKILHNLLSNALKYTPSKGSVDIFTQELTAQQAKAEYPELHNTECCDKYVKITVSDTGAGIPADKLRELFVQYHRIEGVPDGRPDYGGSGIGLYYTKRLTEAHRGAISAVIQPEGGMAFSFILPLQDVYRDDEKETNAATAGRTADTGAGMAIGNATAITDNSLQQLQYTILIVEDNIELMAFIRTMLEGRYRLVCTANGDNAWEIALRDVPDLILSDVLMPAGISGYQFCERVKQHPALSHIPVILLTAKTAISDQIEGLERGADAYICKPFHVDYLLLTIANLLKTKEILRQYFAAPQSRSAEETALVKLNEIDQAFLNKLTQLLEKELSNSELNINSIARELGFSRAGFYRKLKGLMDVSPLDFLRNYRLKCAAEMIREGILSLNEVAEKTGFGTYSYFSVTFKKHYNISPKDFRQKLFPAPPAAK
ncbi:MAG: response regulator [Tannerella sp.]|jgi:signal transduction histidine kinase/ligand-binding sensor domain-containing protein/DNA-binding response OmpR family regulator|nr:response regulator [Tannerella sp.]